MNKVLIVICATFLLYACKKDEPEVINTTKYPTKVNLLFRGENSECNEGTIISDTESSVLFEWSEALHTDEYELNLTNLISGNQTIHTTPDLTILITINRATPFEWYVVSKSDSVDSTAQSDTWRFYNTAEGITSHIPFPAEIVSPTMAETINTAASVIALEWNGNDLDNDIAGYDVYFGTTDNPDILGSDLQTNTINAPISPNTVYYWKVITKDEQGNSSDSGVYQFKIL